MQVKYPSASPLLLMVLLSPCVSAAEQQPAAPVPRHIGTMVPFWRNRPVVDRWLTGELGFTRIPDYLCDSSLSFPYRRRAEAREIPFVNHVTVVRLLGGWNPKWRYGEIVGEDPIATYDLAYRDDTGRIRYRWELLGPRLDPYVKNGYGLTIVLDNTPWCFPKEADDRGMGQAGPPADFAAWGAFIEELCRQLLRLYGADAANQWHFRMGTECQGKDRFSGTQEDFHMLYDHAAAAVERVLPGAKFGPFNLAGGATGPNISYHALAEHCLTGINHATGKIGSPLDFAAVSVYTAPTLFRAILRTTSPVFKAQQKIDFWNALGEMHPQLANISREVHECGVLGNEFGLGHSEPGARHAAWLFHLMMCLREGGMDQLWSWGVLEPINVGGRRQLLNGVGWLFSVLEYTVGGETYVLEPDVRTAPRDVAALPKDLRAVATYERLEKLARRGQLFVKSIAVVRGKRTVVITSAYHEDRFVTKPVDVTVSLPRELANVGAGRQVRQVALTRRSGVHSRIRRDLAAAGLLDAKFAAVPGLLGSVKNMGGHPAWRHVDEQWPKYEAIIKDSLRLKSFEGRMESDGRRHRFSFRVAPPSVLVVVIDG